MIWLHFVSKVIPFFRGVVSTATMVRDGIKLFSQHLPRVDANVVVIVGRIIQTEFK